MPPKQSTPTMQRRAAELRHNQTKAEAALWKALRMNQANGVHFRRQHAVGSYIVDFCSRREKLTIELDGGQMEQAEYDHERSAFPASKGYRILRFWNNDVLKNLDEVMRVILASLD